MDARHKAGHDNDGLSAMHAVMIGKVTGEMALGQEYAEAARDHGAERDALEWIESGVGDTLADEDFSKLRCCMIW